MKTVEVHLTEEQHDRFVAIISQQKNQKTAAAQLEISEGHLSKLLKKGGASPSRLLINKFLQEFKINETWFNTGDGPQYLVADPEELVNVIDTLRTKWPTLNLAKRYELAGQFIQILSNEGPKQDS